MRDFRIVRSQYNEYSVEVLNNHTPRKWVPCGDLRNPIPKIAGMMGYMILEANRRIYNSYQEAMQAIIDSGRIRQWTAVFTETEIERNQCECCKQLSLSAHWELTCPREDPNCIGSIIKER